MKPAWIKKSLATQGVVGMKDRLKDLSLHSVCEEARCPNLPECFSKGVATVMIMGDTCTRSCRFCAVTSGRPRALDPDEPLNVALWANRLRLKHIVITSVDRDDLPDLGSTHFSETIRKVHEHNPESVIEVLTPDFQGNPACLKRICESPFEIYNHNVETVERLTPQVRSASEYRRSLGVIYWVRSHFPDLVTKSGIMLGLGETRSEILQTMKDLVSSGCDLLTLGQYLRPSAGHLPVMEYIHPRRFEEYRSVGFDLGFKAVFSGPFVRSSYLADELFHEMRPHAARFTEGGNKTVDNF
jgi:lipoic acid synthetase